LQTLNELITSITGAKGRFETNLAAANGELSDAQLKRGQESNANVITDWNEWVAFNSDQVAYFQVKLNHATTILANYTAEKAQVEASMTTSCGGTSEQAFDLGGL
jgi:hypothetical protein